MTRPQLGYNPAAARPLACSLGLKHPLFTRQMEALRWVRRWICGLLWGWRAGAFFETGVLLRECAPERPGV